MKRTIYLLMALALMLALLPTTVFAHTEDAPFVVDLLAGQTEDIGDVEVWNDADTLYVKFVSTGDCLLETHVAVATELGGIPQTKKGNPIPGQFEFSDPHACVNEYTYAIPLTWDYDTDLYIAAHAALGKEMTLTVASAGNKADVYGPISQYEPVGDALWGTGKLAPETWVHSNWTDITGAAWISSYGADPGYPEGWTSDGIVPDSWRWFHHEFSVPGPVKEATLVANADNAEEIYVNGTWIASDGEVQGSFTDDHEWATIEGPYYVDVYEGMNALDFIVRNYPATSAGQRNPTALAYKAEIKYYEDGETAWGDGIDFPGKNWATYFTYTVQSPCTNVPNVVNGGFEAPVVGTSQGWNIYDSGTVGLGWTVEWAGSYAGAPNPAHLELHRDVNGWSHYDGFQHAELDTDWQGPGGASGEQASVKISQVVATCPGVAYDLTYAWSPRPSHGDNGVEVFIDGVSVGTHSGSGGSNTDWTLETTSFTAGGTTATIEFVETGTPDSLGMFLDAVSVIEIP